MTSWRYAILCSKLREPNRVLRTLNGRARAAVLSTWSGMDPDLNTRLVERVAHSAAWERSVSNSLMIWSPFITSRPMIQQAWKPIGIAGSPRKGCEVSGSDYLQKTSAHSSAGRGSTEGAVLLLTRPAKRQLKSGSIERWNLVLCVGSPIVHIGALDARGEARGVRGER